MPIVIASPSVGVGLGKVTLATYNGLTFGQAQPVKIVEVGGFDDLPTIRDGNIPRSADHGAFLGSHYLDGRIVTFSLRIAPQGSRAGLEAQIDTLRAALGVQTARELPLTVNGNRQLNCRPTKRFVSDSIDDWGSAWTATAQLEFEASDPRIYDATLQTPSTGLATVSGGMTFPASFPLGFGAPASGGYIFATNAGTFPTRPLAIIAGPVVNPQIQNVTTGDTVKLNITLASTDMLAVDFNARTILLNGTASRYSALTSDSAWFELVPGTTTIRFLASAFAAGTLTLQYRSAWL